MQSCWCSQYNSCWLVVSFGMNRTVCTIRLKTDHFLQTNIFSDVPHVYYIYSTFIDSENPTLESLWLWDHYVEATALFINPPKVFGLRCSIWLLRGKKGETDAQPGQQGFNLQDVGESEDLGSSGMPRRLCGFVFLNPRQSVLKHGMFHSHEIQSFQPPKLLRYIKLEGFPRNRNIFVVESLLIVLPFCYSNY